MIPVFNPEGLENGKKYRIHHQSDSERVMRESVMVFLDAPGGKHAKSTFWSARPVAGTQEMPTSWIKKLWLVDDDVAIKIKGKLSAETRVL
jgi:hypothetical protein